MKSSLVADNRKNALVYYMGFAAMPGGSEYLPLLFISELQQRGYDITLALMNNDADLESVEKLCNVKIDMRKIKVMGIRPRQRFLRRIDAYLPFYRVRQLKKLSKHADVCISCANMIDFGKPAHHVVILLKYFGDNSFMDFYQHKPPISGFPLLKRKIRTFLAEHFLRPLLGVRSTRKIIMDKREHIYLPSRYVADIMRTFYGPFNGTVFYPPTSFDISQIKIPRNPVRVVYLGRIHPEKRITDIIEIVERARELSGFSLELFIGGCLENDSYSELLQKTVSDKSWIQLAGPVYGQKKTEFLLGGTYAVHAERDEAFGISITEYLKAGCIPLVPDEGGSMEVVSNPELTYHTNEDAARIMTHLLSDDVFRQEQLDYCRERAKKFSFECYMDTQHKLLDTILKTSK